MKALFVGIGLALGAHAGLHAWLEARGAGPVLLASPDADPAALVGLGVLFILRIAVLWVVPAVVVGAGLRFGLR